MFGSTIIPLAFAASAFATVYLTEPVSNTSWPAGQSAVVSWQDDGKSPSLADFGLADFAVYVGNAIQQTPLQTIATFVNVSQVNQVTFTPQASIGPDSDEYFVRVTSHSATNGQYAAEAFSAKFQLTGMSGSFNSSIQAEIDGQSTAPIGGPTSTGSGSVPSSTVSSSSSSKSNPTITPTSTSTPSSNGAAAGKPAIAATGFVALVAVAVGASFL